MSGSGCYPGTFNPLTVAHLAVGEAAWRQLGLDRVDLVVSRRPLGKEDADRPALDDRVAVLHAAAAARPWLGVKVTDDQLLADVARGYDVLILGTDKWAQVLDPAWYGSEAERDRALARLPRAAVAPRPPFPVPPGAVVLVLPPELQAVSSTAVRRGHRDWMAPEAAAAARADPQRYEAWLRDTET